MHKKIGYKLHVKGSINDENDKPTMDPMKLDGAATFSVGASVPSFGFWFVNFIYMILSKNMKNTVGCIFFVRNEEELKLLNKLISFRIVV